MANLIYEKAKHPRICSSFGGNVAATRFHQSLLFLFYTSPLPVYPIVEGLKRNIADLQISNSNQSNQNLERLYIRGVVRSSFGCTPCLGQEQTRLRPDQTSFCNVLDLTGTMVYLPDTMVDLPNTMVDLPNTMVDLPNTMVDLPNNIYIIFIFIQIDFQAMVLSR